MQQALMDFRSDRFMTNLNALLMDGWTIVPGSFYATSVEQASVNVPERLRTPHGTFFDKVFFVCVQNDEVQ